MATFRPKEVLQQARDAEQRGNTREAASHYASLSVYLRRRGKHDEALTLIRRALSLTPQYSRLYLQLALCNELKGELDQADSAMERFTQLVIEKRKVEQYQPLVESSLKDHPRLRQKFFDSILALDKTGPVAFLGRARSLKQQGDEEGALKVLLEALRVAPQSSEVLAQIEDVLRLLAKSEGLIHLGRYKEGKISVENLVILLSGSAEGESSQEFFYKDKVEKPLKELIEELEKEIGFQVQSPQQEIQPLLKEFRRRSSPILGQDARARMDMGLAFFEMGLVKEAEEELAVVEETSPLYAEAQALQGEISLSQGNALAALDAFQKSLRAAVRTPELEREARYKLVQVFYRLGDLRQAFSQAAELEKLAPDYRGLRQLKNQIQEEMEKQAGGSSSP